MGLNERESGQFSWLCSLSSEREGISDMLLDHL